MHFELLAANPVMVPSTEKYLKKSSKKAEEKSGKTYESKCRSSKRISDVL
jgi:hypothetical protein